MADWHGPTDLSALAVYASNRMRNDYDFVWAAVGPPGTGKSSLNLQFGAEIQAPVPIVVREQVVFRPSDVVHVARRLGKYKVILPDEASRQGGNKRRSMSAANVDQMEYLDTCRAFNQALGYATPEYDHLDSAIQERLQWLLHLQGRGHGIAYEMQHRGKPGDRIHFPKARFEFRFPDLWETDPEQAKEYLAFKAEFLSGRNLDGVAKQRSLEDRMVAAIQGVVGEAVPS